jgi:hypothetical protein
MLFQRMNRGDPERIFMVMLNNEGAALEKDSCVQLEMDSASVDGVRMRAPDTGNLFAFIGVVDAAIANGDYGLVQTYGYRSTSKLLTTDTSIATGAPLIPVAGQVYFASVASTLASNTAVTMAPVFAVLGESVTTSTGTVSRKIFIRAM